MNATLDCTSAVPHPIDMAPVRSPQAAHTFLLRWMRGKELVEAEERKAPVATSTPPVENYLSGEANNCTGGAKGQAIPGLGVSPALSLSNAATPALLTVRPLHCVRKERGMVVANAPHFQHHTKPLCTCSL